MGDEADDSIARAALRGLYRLISLIPPGEEVEAAGTAALLWLILRAMGRNSSD